MWSHLGTCLHANPWVVRRNLEEEGDRMLSAIAVVSKITAKNKRKIIFNINV